MAIAKHPKPEWAAVIGNEQAEIDLLRQAEQAARQLGQASPVAPYPRARCGARVLQVKEERKTAVNVSPEEFVKAWQAAESLDEFVENTGLDHCNASARASHYRKLGVMLKMMPRGGGVNVAALNKLIEEGERKTP